MPTNTSTEPEEKECYRCHELKEVRDFVPDTDCCVACHELEVMKVSNAGVVKVSCSGHVYLS